MGVVSIFYVSLSKKAIFPEMSNFFFFTKPGREPSFTVCGFNLTSYCFSGLLIPQGTFMQIWPQVIHHLCVFRKNQMFSTYHTAVSVIAACPRHMYCLFFLCVFSLCPFLRLFFSFLFLCARVILTLWVQGVIQSSWSPAKTNTTPQPERRDASVGEKRGEGIGGREERGRCWKRVEEVERKC